MRVVRFPAVAGTFYPASPERLREWLVLPPQATQVKAAGALSPHAGYIYSGSLSRQVFSGIKVPDRVLLLNPNHTGRGPAVSLYPPGVWQFPGFEVPISDELTYALEECFRSLIPRFRFDTQAHEREHSGEVLVPFLYGSNPQVRISVVTLAHLPLEFLQEMAQGIAEVLQRLGDLGSFLIVVSSDMTHYEPAELAAQKDSLVFPFLESIDGVSLYRTVEEEDLTMCGYIPATLALLTLKRIGVNRGLQVGYTHSGNVTGDHHSVVSYVGYWFVQDSSS